jgi:hypothetical protein
MRLKKRYYPPEGIIDKSALVSPATLKSAIAKYLSSEPFQKQIQKLVKKTRSNGAEHSFDVYLGHPSQNEPRFFHSRVKGGTSPFKIEFDSIDYSGFDTNPLEPRQYAMTAGDREVAHILSIHSHPSHNLLGISTDDHSVTEPSSGDIHDIRLASINEHGFKTIGLIVAVWKQKVHFTAFQYPYNYNPSNVTDDFYSECANDDNLSVLRLFSLDRQLPGLSAQEVDMLLSHMDITIPRFKIY